MTQNYRLDITVDGYDDFHFSLLASPQDTFLSLHNSIIEAINFEGGQIASFQICDKEWIREGEITLINMDDEEQPDLMLMESTLLGDVVSGELRNFVYEYDFACQWRFFITVEDSDSPAIEETPYLLDMAGSAPSEADGLLRSKEGLEGEDMEIMAGLHRRNKDAFSAEESWEDAADFDEDDDEEIDWENFADDSDY